MADLLWIDNDARLVELAALLLARRGHTVRTAGSFGEARERLAESRPELVLSDLDLGAETGRTELPALAREGLLPPTLIVSGFLDRALDEELRTVPGVLGTLAKPFDLDRLCERIEECLAATGADRVGGASVARATARAMRAGADGPGEPRGGGTRP